MEEMKLNRKQYEKIRKMDHGQMQEYFMRVYLDGVDEGKRQKVKEEENVDTDAIAEKIQEIKGIGRIKANQIVSIVMESMKG